MKADGYIIYVMLNEREKYNSFTSNWILYIFMYIIFSVFRLFTVETNECMQLGEKTKVLVVDVSARIPL
jgi:hypothetical protein